MSEENTLTTEGGEALSGTQQQASPQRAPTNDFEAAQQEEAAKAQAAQEEHAKRRNPTTEFIDKLKRENREMRRSNGELEARLQALESQFPKKDPDARPTREEFDFDEDKFQEANEKWLIKQAQKSFAEEQKASSAQAEHQKTFDRYISRATEFAEKHPDFEEVVGGGMTLPAEFQLAIMAHESGPEIAYYLGTHDDEAFSLINTRAGYEKHALDRLASRIKSAQTQQPSNEGNPAVAAINALAGVQTTKSTPTSNAPAPVPSLGGRSTIEPDEESMSDEEWFKRRQAKRKRS